MYQANSEDWTYFINAGKPQKLTIFILFYIVLQFTCNFGTPLCPNKIHKRTLGLRAQIKVHSVVKKFGADRRSGKA